MPSGADLYTSILLSEENVKKYVLPAYNLEDSEISQIKFKNTEKQRAVYKITNKNKYYCLKKVYFGLEELLFVYSALEWFFRHEINVPKILPTTDGNRYVFYNNMLFMLTPWVEGEKCNYDNLFDMLKASHNLGNMHKLGKNFKPIEGSALRKDFNNIYNSMNRRLEKFLFSYNSASKHNDKFSRFFLDNFDNNLNLAQIALTVSSNINHNNLSKSLCHLDYVNKNLIIDIYDNIWVIDFDKCKLDYCAHDISYFLRRYMRRNKTKWNVNFAISCLESYENAYTLNIDDYKYILVYLSFPQKFWKISKDYYNNIDKCNKKAFLKLIINSNKNIKYKLDFINFFIDYIEDKFKCKII
ncbi:spore coat protein I [Clostridium acetireducens DSM 10703]|uniref:Spore coat protein I n=1 Tax=Clostridium acetireducens DSM 10703 TaxID=1121290 RepID=A0A1E8F1E7_9CLOT|nr:CotS family spore coat protein [Clostridium acetireducens]OFI07172.1 spore coat protein I [Clostridium acetireducens DSM 10703]